MEEDRPLVNKVIGVIVVVVIMSFMTWMTFTTPCSRHTLPMHFKGVVTRKYIGPYKNSPIIMVTCNGRDVEFGPGRENSAQFYSQIHIGDSMIKKKGAYEFEVIRNGEHKVFYVQDCCPNNCRDEWGNKLTGH